MHSRMEFIIPLFYLLALHATFQGCYSAVNQSRASKKPTPGRSSSAVVLPVTGNVYPRGYYHVTVNIGNPPKPYWLDIDTGSDLTWVQCDAPCTKCSPAPHKPYKPSKDFVRCTDPLCSHVHWPENLHCESPKEQCDYAVQYADHGSTMGILVKDSFPLQFINGTTTKPRLAFGCGYDQEIPAMGNQPYTDGILGLGLGKASILSQLNELGITRNIVGHCLSAQGGGYMFFGDIVPPGVIWAPMLKTEIENHYSLGNAELYVGGKTTRIKDLPIVFDSGSTYTYLSAEAYKALVSMLMEDIKERSVYLANEDKSLPVCWKGSKPFKSIYDVKNIFKPIILSFENSENSRLQLDPVAYLIISKQGNVCLGILNGSDVGLESTNLIGDISMLDKMIIYDNDKQHIGWAPANCNKLPNIDDDGDHDNGGLCKPYKSNFGILQAYCAP